MRIGVQRAAGEGRGGSAGLRLAAAACELLVAAGCGPAGPRDSGAPLDVHLALSTNTIHVGTPVTAVVTVYHAPGTSVTLPETGRGREIVVRDRARDSREAGPGRLRTEARYTLTSFVLGEHAVFTGAVECVQSNAPPLTAPLPAAGLRVVSILGSPDEAPRDMKGPLAWPPRIPRWAWIAPLGALAVLATLLGLARLLRRGGPIRPPPPVPTPHERALDALRRLRAKGYIEQGTSEPFYVELSSIVRTYLEERFGLRAPERTTEEFIREAAESHRLEPGHQVLTRGFLEQCDLVKFARWAPDEPMMESALAAAEKLVRETIPGPANPQGREGPSSKPQAPTVQSDRKSEIRNPKSEGDSKSESGSLSTTGNPQTANPQSAIRNSPSAIRHSP